MNNQPHVITLTLRGKKNPDSPEAEALLDQFRDETGWKNYKVAKGDATILHSDNDLQKTIKNLRKGLKIIEDSPDQFVQLWLTIQTVDISSAQIVVPLGNAFPEIIRENFGLVPKKKPFRLWPFGRRE